MASAATSHHEHDNEDHDHEHKFIDTELHEVHADGADKQVHTEDLTDNLSMTSAGDVASAEETSSSNHISTNLLKLDTKGCIGLIERLPVVVKALLVSTVAIIGMLTISICAIALRGNILNEATGSLDFIRKCQLVSTTVQAFQAERLRGGLMLLNPNDYTIQIEFMKTVTASDLAISQLDQIFSSSFGAYPAMKDAQIDVSNSYGKLAEIRAKATSKVITTSNLAVVYENLITDLLNMIHVMGGVAGYSVNSALYSLYFEQVEAGSSIVFSGYSILANTTFDPARYQVLAANVGKRAILDNYLLTSAPKTLAATFQEKLINTPSRRKIDSMINEMLAGNKQLTFTAADWFNLTSQFSAERYVVTALFSQDLETYGTELLQSSIIWICIFVALFIIFGVTSVFATIFFSTTVVRPWKRLNDAQESTIAKFVPKGFLSLMGWKRISDAALGKCTEKDFSIVVLKMTDLRDAASHMRPEESYAFMNNFITYIGPYIRANRGYIDKIIGSKVILIFHKNTRAIRAALEIHSTLNSFNKVQDEHHKPQVHVTLSIVTDKGYIGTLGENEHMEGAVLSSNMPTALKLAKISKKIGASILATRKTIALLPKKRLYYRYLGIFTLKDLEKVELFELLQGEPQKAKTRDSFSKAVHLLQTDEFFEALQSFEHVCKANPNDILAFKYRDLCKTVIDQNIKKMAELDIETILFDSSMETAFEHFCGHEMSSENIELWKAIENYKKAEPSQRKELAHTIYTDFLVLSGKTPVNLNEVLISPIKQHIHNQEAIYVASMFNDIEDAVELNLIDTLKRFRESPSFKEAYLNSSLLITKEEINYKTDL